MDAVPLATDCLPRASVKMANSIDTYTLDQENLAIITQVFNQINDIPGFCNDHLSML